MSKMKCRYCGSEKVYLFSIINQTTEIYDCPDCHKRTIIELQQEVLEDE